MKRYTIEQFMATISIMGASFSADEERILFSSNESGIFNAYTLPVTGGMPEPLTRSAIDTTFSVSFFPHDDRVLITRDYHGDENYHLFLLCERTTPRISPSGSAGSFTGFSLSPSSISTTRMTILPSSLIPVTRNRPSREK